VIAQQPTLTFESFVTCEGSAPAVNAAMAFAEGTLAALFLRGDTGAGKSHLLQAIRNRVHAQSVLHISARELAEQMIGSYRREAWNEVPDRLATHDVLLVDDLELVHTPVAERSLLDMFCQAVNHGTRVALASRCLPTNAFVRDAVIVDVPYPDERARREILERAAAARKLALPRDVIEAAAASITGTPRELESFVARRAFESMIAS
jgi:chromosomal replication initiation ATPase DnaA